MQKEKKRSVRLLLLFGCIVLIPLWSGSLWAVDNRGELKKERSLSEELRKALKESAVSSRQLGVIVADADRIFYQLNADQSFIPASLIKIFTASALLDLLPPSLQFSTRFLAKNKAKNSVLKEDLYLKGGGDPGFVSESLWNLINNLTRTELKRIEGDLVVDDSRFDGKRKGRRLPRSSHSSYDAPIGALSFNWNTANLYLRPGRKEGSLLRITVDPASSYFFSIENQTKTVNGRRKKHLSIQRKRETSSGESLKISGYLSVHHKEVLVYRNILHPEIWAGRNAIEFLKQRGINITGKLRRGKAPRNAFVMAEWQSRQITEHIELMMKYSNNFMVEMLVKNMVVELTGKMGNLKDGLKIIKKHIQKIGIAPQEYNMIQASGLSRENRVKPKHLLTVLRYWLNHPLQPEFESALPLSGEDGTLKKYFKNSALRGRIHAKTGSINGVSGLAGYVITRSNKKRVFVFLFNGSVSLKKKAEDLFRKWAYIVWSF